MAVPYVDYNELREFYTIKDVCKLFEMTSSCVATRLENGAW